MFARYEPTETSLAVNHQSQFVASTISFNLPEDVSLSQATRAIEDALARIGVPTTVRGSFQGSARAFRAALETQPILILTALLTLYIVLGVLYESWVHPLTILSTLPSAGVGALVALMLFRTEFSVIAMIGVIMLIGIVQKNAIMMIDFALATQRSRDVSSRDAIFEACLLRFRPILMTTVAALLASIPLALGRGDGAELRQPLGIAIGGGLILSQLLTLYTTPIVYLYLDRLQAWARRLRSAAPRHPPSAPHGGRALTMSAAGPPKARMLPLGGSAAAPAASVGAHHASADRARLLRLACAAAVVAGTVSCTVGPDYVRPPVDVPAAYKEAKELRSRRRRASCRAAAGGRSTAIASSTSWNRRSKSTTRPSLRPRRACGRRRR